MLLDGWVSWSQLRSEDLFCHLKWMDMDVWGVLAAPVHQVINSSVTTLSSYKTSDLSDPWTSMAVCSVEQEFTHFVCQWMLWSQLWSQLWSEDVSCQLQIKVKIQPCIQYFRKNNHNLQQIIPATSPLVQLGFSFPAIKWQESELQYIDIGNCDIPAGHFSKLPSSPWHLSSDLNYINCIININCQIFRLLDILTVTTVPNMMRDTNLQNSSPFLAFP